MGTFVIAEAGSSHDNDISKAYRLIEAAKECGADAVKFQYWGSSKALATRRGIPDAEPKYEACRLPREWLKFLLVYCDTVGIEFMCSTFLLEDIAVIAPIVKRLKISAFEATWVEFVEANCATGKDVILSRNPDQKVSSPYEALTSGRLKHLHCISEYPTAIERVGLSRFYPQCKTVQVTGSRWEGAPLFSDSTYHGLSDHTANVLTGAAAVAAGAKVIESHIRLEDTSPSNPDYPHSLSADGTNGVNYEYGQYVRNIRTVERML